MMAPFCSGLERRTRDVVSWCTDHQVRFTALAGATMAALMVVLAPFGDVLRWDAYLYVVKASEIAAGDWAPPHTHFIGWPSTLAAAITAKPSMAAVRFALISRRSPAFTVSWL